MVSKTYNLFKKIIMEAEEATKDKNVVDGKEEKPNMIQEDDLQFEDDETTEKDDKESSEKKEATEEKDESKSDDKKDGEELIKADEDKYDEKEDEKDSIDPSEEEFIKNIIKVTELQASNDAIKSFIKTVSSNIGVNSNIYTEYAKSRLAEINEEFKDVVASIKSSREQIIKDAEKAKNKENLISVFDKAVDKAEASEKESKNEIESIISDSAKK